MGAPHIHVGRPAHPCGAPRTSMWGAPHVDAIGNHARPPDNIQIGSLRITVIVNPAHHAPSPSPALGPTSTTVKFAPLTTS